MLEQLLNASSLIVCTLDGKLNDKSEEQEANAAFPIAVTPLPNVTLVSPLQAKKALSPTLVTPFPIVTFWSPEQYKNAVFPMLVTLSGINALVNLFLFANAFALIEVQSLSSIRLVALSSIKPTAILYPVLPLT